MIRRPSRSTRTTPPFPDQTLFRARSIRARIVARDLDGDVIDVAGQHIAMRKLGDGNRKLACSGADIESIDMHTRSDEFGNEFETAGCRFVVACAEGLARIDKKRSDARRYLAEVGGAIDEKTSGVYREIGREHA